MGYSEGDFDSLSKERLGDWEAVSFPSPEVCKFSRDILERSSALEEVGPHGLSHHQPGTSHHSLAALGQSYRVEPPGCLDVRFPARHDISSALISHRGL